MRDVDILKIAAKYEMKNYFAGIAGTFRPLVSTYFVDRTNEKQIQDGI